MTPPHDRLTAEPGEPESGWTGRWAEGTIHIVDAASGSANRDAVESDDLDALMPLAQGLADAMLSGSWYKGSRVPLLSGRDEEGLQLHARERILETNLPSIARVCERFVTRLGERSELLPVARVKRPARKALTRLSAHTEDWAARTLAGPVPRRALAATREENADLYENRMVTELVHPILTTALSQRIRRLHRLTSDLADLEKAKDEGTHHRRHRLYAFWGADAARAAESSTRAAQTLRVLEALAARVQSLRGSSLAETLRGRRTGRRGLRNTNVIANDRHYRAAGMVWSAYEREPEVDKSPEERVTRFRSRHQTFDNYVFGLIIRALGDLGYSPDEDELPGEHGPVAVRGTWGAVDLARGPDGVIVLTSHNQNTRFVPLLDLVGPNDEPQAIARRWASVVGAAKSWTVVVHLAADEAIRRLPHELAIAMSSAGHDAVNPEQTVTGLPVSPLETTSLERVARAVAIAVQVPALLDYPRAILPSGARMPDRLIDYVMDADIAHPGLSPLFHRPRKGEIAIRRPLTDSESTKLDATIRRLSDRAKSPGWERDLITEIESLRSAVESTAASTAGLLTCPLCATRSDTTRVGREADIFVITCRSCEARWGHERCGQCGERIPIIEPERQIRNPDVTGPGWIERIYGRDALSSPCWARTVPGRYICPECRSCSVSTALQGVDCVRCQPVEIVLPRTVG